VVVTASTRVLSLSGVPEITDGRRAMEDPELGGCSPRGSRRATEIRPNPPELPRAQGLSLALDE